MKTVVFVRLRNYSNLCSPPLGIGYLMKALENVEGIESVFLWIWDGCEMIGNQDYKNLIPTFDIKSFLESQNIDYFERVRIPPTVGFPSNALFAMTNQTMVAGILKDDI